MNYRTVILTFLTTLLIIGCGQEKNISPAYNKEITEWKQNRVDNLTRPDSWLSLTGLFWLEPGENNFGTDKSNDLVFPKGEPFMGSFILQDSLVIFRQTDNQLITVNGTTIDEISLKSDITGQQTLLKYKSLTFYLIDRDGRLGIRLKDSESNVLKNFPGLDYFPADESWKVEAGFVPYDPPKIITIPNIIGSASEEECPGYLKFSRNEAEYRLDVLPAGENYFLIFADKTSGDETYGAGRFLYVQKADSAGNIHIDFNKAYNPPCAFTVYATCPLPPKDNYLKLAVTAGEKKFH